MGGMYAPACLVRLFAYTRGNDATTDRRNVGESFYTTDGDLFSYFHGDVRLAEPKHKSAVRLQDEPHPQYYTVQVMNATIGGIGLHSFDSHRRAGCHGLESRFALDVMFLSPLHPFSGLVQCSHCRFQPNWALYCLMRRARCTRGVHYNLRPGHFTSALQWGGRFRRALLTPAYLLVIAVYYVPIPCWPMFGLRQRLAASQDTAHT
ncbi:hypothetical protein GGR58DRAFT_41927 [Xylaria digitata]|nr:hypothetical protein GGR58DRAFT_41927 [Xylaria digitata]